MHTLPKTTNTFNPEPLIDDGKGVKIDMRRWRRGNDYLRRGLVGPHQLDDAIKSIGYRLFWEVPNDFERAARIRAILVDQHHQQSKTINAGRWEEVEQKILGCCTWRPRGGSRYPDRYRFPNKMRRDQARRKIRRALTEILQRGETVTARKLADRSGCSRNTVRTHRDIYENHSGLPSGSGGIMPGLRVAIPPKPLPKTPTLKLVRRPSFRWKEVFSPSAWDSLKRIQYVYGTHRWDSIYMSERGCWQTAKYPLQWRDIPRAIYGYTVLGFRAGEFTRYMVVDLDVGGAYHDPESLQRIMKVLEELGLKKRHLFRSSRSGGWHVVVYWDRPVTTLTWRKRICRALHAAGIVVNKGDCEVVPDPVKRESLGQGVRMPGLKGSALLCPDTLETLIEFDALTPDQRALALAHLIGQCNRSNRRFV